VFRSSPVTRQGGPVASDLGPETFHLPVGPVSRPVQERGEHPAIFGTVSVPPLSAVKGGMIAP